MPRAWTAIATVRALATSRPLAVCISDPVGRYLAILLYNEISADLHVQLVNGVRKGCRRRRILLVRYYATFAHYDTSRHLVRRKPVRALEKHIASAVAADQDIPDAERAAAYRHNVRDAGRIAVGKDYGVG